MQKTISISISEIVYDIQNKTYLTGKSHADGANHRQVAQMQANNDDDNLNQILRSIQMAVANIRQELGEWITANVADLSNKELPDASKEITLTVELPSNFNQTMARPLTDSIHSYIVAFAVSEWFVITNKADAAQYTEIAAESLKMVARSLSQRVRPTQKIGTGQPSIG